MRVYITLLWMLTLLYSCKNQKQESLGVITNQKNYQYLDLKTDFKSLWFDGKAEISSYRLTQMRYGEPREGKAVLIFVKEPFLKDAQVKANQTSQNSVDVMKLNFTKNFYTGIYPYNIMQSIFYPLTTRGEALKISSSVQEWCGHTYMQLNNREDFHINFHSYFEGEADQNFTFKKTVLENELWIKLRLDPTSIPTGKTRVIPDFSYLQLKHKVIKPYQAQIDQKEVDEGLVTTISYEKLTRTLKIYQENKFPYTITKWEEIDSAEGVTKAVLQKKLRLDYWNKNSNTYQFLRDSLQLTN